MIDANDRRNSAARMLFFTSTSHHPHREEGEGNERKKGCRCCKLIHTHRKEDDGRDASHRDGRAVEMDAINNDVETGRKRKAVVCGESKKKKDTWT